MNKTLQRTCYVLLAASLSLGTISCSVFKRNKAQTSKTAESKKNKPNKDEPQPYSKVITKKAKTDKGLFAVHYLDNKYYYEIPDSLLNRDMLMVTRIAKTASNLGFGGGKQNTQVLNWEKRGDKLNLRVKSYRVYAADSLPIHQAVKNSNLEPILYSFDIAAYNTTDSTTTAQQYVIDATPLFNEDVPAIGFPQARRSQYKIRNLDKQRSYVDTIRAYPLNIETRHVKTYNSTEPPSERSVASFTVEMSNSMILLPKEPMERRYYDQRVGWFARGQTDYGQDAQRSKTVRYLDRWRLEVKDEDRAAFERGELVEPKKPIVYYIDPATPVRWRKYIKQGIEDWQVAFEAAGFKNAILAKDAPTPQEDPDWSPEDVRYSTVRYLASPIPNANGPHVSDPRSGEILESDINWYHNVMTLLRNWYFVQTAAINPDAQSPEFKDEVMGRLIRFVSAHEVGHTLGLPHNMGSSVAYPVEKLRDPAFTKKYGTAPSIMDYARFNYVAQPGDGDVALMPNIGPYDKYSIMWGYRPILDKAGKEEKPVLDQWILEKAGDPMYRFGRQQFGVIDPSSQTEDLGDDSMRASEYGIANLKRIVPNLIEWTGEDGKDYEDLDDLYGQVVGQYRRYMGHVVSNIGGVYEYYKTYDQDGTVYQHVPREKQERAMQFLQEQLFMTPSWLIDNEITGRTEYDGTLERIRGLQTRTLNQLLDFGRLQRMMENEEINGREAYGMLEMMDDLRSGLFSELTSGAAVDRYRRNLQRAYVERLETVMTAEAPDQRNRPSFARGTQVDVSTSDIRPVVRAQLKTLQRDSRAAARRTRDTMTEIHLIDLAERIESILNPKD